MSAFLLGIGFRADMGTCARKLVLLKLIDACEDDGTRIFPAIATIARAAQCSTRQVQRELQAFRDAGLIRLVKEGGKGPRSTNEYSLDLDLLHRIGREGWAAVVDSKDDTVSPLDEAEKGDTDDMERVTPATDKGDIACHPTPPEPSSEPSVEREGAREAREAENRKSVERGFEKAYRQWPTSITDSRPEAQKAWNALTPDERDAATAEIGRYVEASKAVGRKLVCSFGVYLREKRWAQLPPAPEPKPEPVIAPPFGPMWGGLRMLDLLSPAEPSPPPTSAFIAQLIAQDDAAGRAERMRRQKQFGWPMVNRIHDAAERRRGVTVPPELEWVGGLTEFVPTDTEIWEAWKLEHEQRGWPWLPDPGGMGGAYFPRGGPHGLHEFEAAVKSGKGDEDDGGGREAAE
ncbi:MAG: hypothetical protein EPN45_12650 [Rhizobiaceae bacterium]|nr:MAG: hypothetical protein EPN45_12650 [Rhizobiaceae bacterium]